MEDLQIGQFDLFVLDCPVDDPRVAEFGAAFDRVRALAESSEGFVWRLSDPSLSPADIELFSDPLSFFTLCVWRDLESLRRFAWHMEHLDFYQHRKKRFSNIIEPHSVMWWIREGHCPTLTEARSRLRLLETKGTSRHAFDWDTLPEGIVDLG